MLIRVGGVIDETFQADDLVTGSSGVVVIDLDGVQRITSFGIRAFTQALRRLRADYYCFIRCQPSIVSQLNLVTGFAARGEVVSFHAPYFCPACERSTSVLFDLRRADHRQAVATLDLPLVSCPDCGAACELDDIPDLYFQYVRASSLPSPPVLAHALIDGRETGQAFVIEKQIADTVTGLWMSGVMDRPGYFRRLADGLQGHVVVVTADVEDVTPQGLKAFRSFVATPDLSIYLARVPPCLVEGLAGAPERLGDAQLLSVMLPFHCGRCARMVTIEVPATALTPSGPGAAWTGRCPDCSHRAAPRPPEGLVASALALPRCAPPPPVRDYLAHRPSSPGPAPDPDAGAEPAAGNPLGKYQIQKRLGRGGMGEVFLARHTGPAGFEKLVVIKRVRADRVGDGAAVDLFLQEARLSARLSHPNLVQIFDLGKVADGYFLTMEYVDGPDLRSLLSTCRQLGADIPIELCCRILSDVCQGLHAAHHHRDESGQVRPIIHRDVTPGNVLLSLDGVVKLTDFGIAKTTDSDHETQPGQLKGTVRFMAPEVLMSPRQASSRPTVDIYAVGVLLYECLTTRPLFPSENWAGTVQAVLEQPIPRLSQHRAGISPALERTFQRAVARDPAERHQDVQELHDELEQAIRALGRPATSQELSEWLGGIMARASAQAQPGKLIDADPTVDIDDEVTSNKVRKSRPGSST